MLTLWQMKQRKGLLSILLVVTLLPQAGLANDAEILDLARKTIEKVRYAAFATVDDNGQPRTRIVDAFAPDEDFVIFVATKPNTRKVNQIKAHNRVTLFYFDDEGRNYVSLMGEASLIDDEAMKRAMRREADSDRIYPNFPNDYLLIRIEPIWLEGLLPGYRGDRETWTPARVDFSARGSSAK